jgi:hypothetical protein
MLAHVGQGLPDDPVRGPPDQRRGEGRVTLLGQLGRRAHADRLGDQRRQAVRGRRLVAVRMRAQDPDQVAQLVQGLAAGDPQVLGGLPGRLVRGGHPQRPGLQHHQADPVGHHVVHLARQPAPFLGPGLLGEQVALALGPVGPVAQRLQQRVAGPEVQRQQRPHQDAEQPVRDDLDRGLPGPAHDHGQHGDGQERNPPVPPVVEGPVGRERRGERRPHVAHVDRGQGARGPDQQRDRQRERGQDGDHQQRRPAPGDQRQAGGGLDAQQDPGQRPRMSRPPGDPDQRRGRVQQHEEDRKPHVERGPVPGRPVVRGPPLAA